MNNIPWEVAGNLTPTERRAYFYKIAQCNGGTVNWETGEISYDGDNT